MKTIVTALALSLAATFPAWAEDVHHPDQPPAASAPTPDKAVQKMRENAVTMQSQVEAIANAKAPDERQRLLMEHMQTMRENMMLGQQVAAGQPGQAGCQMMDGTGMGMMGGMGMMHGKAAMTGSEAAAASPGAMAWRMHQMERRMDMMQMMMEGMSRPSRKATGK